MKDTNEGSLSEAEWGGSPPWAVGARRGGKQAAHILFMSVTAET